MLKYKVKNTDLVEFKKKRLARSAVAKALRHGQLIRSNTCDLCNDACRTEAHHKDYGRQLDVMWLCDACHGIAHRSDSDLNPLNNPQTPTADVWTSCDMVTVSFNIPVRQFMILKDQAKNSKKKMSTILRDNLIKDFPVESSQLEFNFEGNADEANNEHNARIQSVGKNESEMLQQKLPSVQIIRRERDSCLPRMDAQSTDFYFGYGTNARPVQCACAS